MPLSRRRRAQTPAAPAVPAPAAPAPEAPAPEAPAEHAPIAAIVGADPPAPLDRPRIARLDTDERAEAGRAARARASRSAHGDWAPAPGRRDPVEILQEQAVTRVPELVPIRYGRMMVSPFTFYRGAAAVMAADLASTPVGGLIVQLCGDAHISNFGGFGSPDRTIVFDLNDFDETLPGPWEWDVKRMAASLEIAAREKELTAAQRAEIVADAVGQYRQAMRSFAARTNLDVWYARLTEEELAERFGVRKDTKAARQLDKAVAKAKQKDSRRALAKLTETVDGRLRFISAPPLLVPVEELLPQEDAERVMASIDVLVGRYRQTLPEDRAHLLDTYRTVHMARKVVGVGSVGTRAWVLLMEGRDGNDPLVLQAKEANASVLEPYAGASRYDNHGQRVVEGQRLMQAASDIFLGWETAPGVDGLGHDFYLRQLWDWKTSADIASLRAPGLSRYAGACAWTLARAHARSGDRLAIAAYLGAGSTFDKAIARFAAAYADQNELDHAALVQAVQDGRVEAEQGV